MNCPACTGLLSAVQLSAIEVDLCADGCGGVWLDRGELEKFDATSPEAKRVTAAQFQPATKFNPLNAPRRCPKCDNEFLLREWIDDAKQIEIDMCLHCRGIWLDQGELKKISALAASERSGAGEVAIEQSVKVDLSGFATGALGAFKGQSSK